MKKLFSFVAVISALIIAAASTLAVPMATSVAAQTAPTATATRLARPTATPTPKPKTTNTPRPAPGITVQPIAKVASVKSYKMAIAMKLDGVSDGKVAKGDFTVDASSLVAAKKQNFAIGGNTMGLLLGKYLRGLPVSRITLYLFDKNTYILAQSLLPVCAVPKTPIAGLNDLKTGLSAEVLFTSLTGSNTFFGTLVGDETVNGIATRRYKLDIPRMNALAKQNRVDAQLKSGEVWLAKDGNYVVRLVTDAIGSLAKATGVDYKGNVTININVSDLNKVPDIALPGACNRPIQI
jgi:hypothetical protein